MKLEEIGRRGFIVFLLATLAAASAPAIAAPKRAATFVLKRSGIAPGTEVWAVAEGRGPEQPMFYNVRALVTVVRRISDDCYVWSVECEPGHDVFWYTESVAGHVKNIRDEIPQDILDWAFRRAAEGDLYWRHQIEATGNDMRAISRRVANAVWDEIDV